MAHQLLQDPVLFEAGDRLTPEEFLARWESMPNLKFAELINGVVYLPSPVSPKHGEKVYLINGWTAGYVSRVGIITGLTDTTWLMEKSVPQPDIALRIKPQFGGTSTDTETYPSGPPEFVAEVSRSTRSYDLGPKLELYERVGVREYLAALLEEQRLEWRILESGKYQLIPPDAEGVFRSRVFPGLWLDQQAFWNNDLTAILARLEQGLQSPEFLQFRESRQRR